MGGVEFSFMSCTTDRKVALEYARGGYLFQINTGLVCRGSSLSWISYYPHEQEVCFGPMTALDVVGKQGMDQGCVVVELSVVRLSAPFN